MIETKIIEYLKQQNIKGIGTNVYAEVPVDRIDEYIIVSKLSGGSRELVEQAVVAVQSTSSISLFRAATLNDQVKAVMNGFTSVKNVFGCGCNTDYNFTDKNTKEYRYQAVFNINYKEAK